MPSLKFDMSEWHKAVAKISKGSPLYGDLILAVQSRGVVALVAQAIADNFRKEGPGWEPLKASTIRRSVAGKKAKALAKMTDAQILEHEAKARQKGSEETPNRQILRKTSLLFRTATTPGFTGSNKKASGSNISRYEGTNLIFGTNLVYAAIHNYGDPKRKIPKREFLVIREEWKAKINLFLAERIIERIRQSWGGK